MMRRMVVILAFFGLLITSATVASYIVQPAKAQTPTTGPGSTVQSGSNVADIVRHLFCNTGVITPICN
jgi:hypothetical protein